MRMATPSSFPSLFSELVFRSVTPRLTTFAVLLSVAASPAPAQEGHLVSGRVVDAEDGRTLAGVNIVIKGTTIGTARSEEHTSELQSQSNLVCRLLLEKKKKKKSLNDLAKVLDIRR